MLDDYKYSIGRLVVYRHPNPRLPRQSYGQQGHERTIGEIIAVDMDPNPEPHWMYTIRNVRNQEIARVGEGEINFATTVSAGWKKNNRQNVNRIEDGALAEMIAKALSSPQRANFLRSTLKDFLYKEELAEKAYREGPDLPVYPGDYIRIRGDLRNECESLNNHYAKVLSVEPSDIAGIENPQSKPGQPRLYRTIKKYKIISSEEIESEIYDVEIKLFYTAHGRKTILNWRAATLLAEAFKDEPPYNVEYDYLTDHVYTREDLKQLKRVELTQLLASLLYVKGKIGLRDFQRRNQFLAGSPKTHLIDNILELSRFDAHKNRFMTREEIVSRRQDEYKLRRLLKGS